MSIEKFSQDIKKFREKVERKSTKILQEVAQEVSTRIAKRTGVDTGNLLGNYLMGVNSFGEYPNFEPGESTWEDGTKDHALARYNKERALKFVLPRIELLTNTLTYRDTWYFGSAEDYVENVEYTGWHKTPPYRMFGVTRKEFPLIVEEIALKNKNV